MDVLRVGDGRLDAALVELGHSLTDDQHAAGLVTVMPIVELHPIAELDPEEWLGAFRACAEEPFFAAQEWLRAALERRSGSWVAVTSAVGTRPFPSAASAGVPAVALHTLVRVAAVEGGPRGVRANAVAPGWGEGELPEQLDGALAVRDTPSERLATPADVAAAVDFLLSPAAAHVTGEVLRVDGGYTISSGSRSDPT